VLKRGRMGDVCLMLVLTWRCSLTIDQAAGDVTDYLGCVCAQGQVLIQAGGMWMLNVEISSGKQVGDLKLLTPLLSRVIRSTIHVRTLIAGICLCLHCTTTSYNKYTMDHRYSNPSFPLVLPQLDHLVLHLHNPP
jgi:hypothetical protein